MSIILKIAIQILIWISKIGELPYSYIYVATPSILEILIYFLLLSIARFIFYVFNSKYITPTIVRFKNVKELLKFYIKYRLPKKKKSEIVISIIIVIIFTLIIKIYPKDLRIHFVDVGQGDCTFIETPSKKSILIDGGGSTYSDVGKNTLLPYILDRGYTKIDVMFISHFDSDHFLGLLTVMENIKVKQVIISRQRENSENYKRFLEVAKKKNINIKVVKKGDRVSIEENLYFDIIWPNNNLEISENALNNNAIVAKFCYGNFSMLYTGDIEEKAEKAILNEYAHIEHEGGKSLKSMVLKVAHHGSKTSSTEDFINAVSPRVALIGVGKDNNFGHPNEDVLKRFENHGMKIYRTDENGEISIRISNGNINISTHIDLNR